MGMQIVLWSLLLVASPVVEGVTLDGVQVVPNLDYVDSEDYADGKDRLDLYLPEGKLNFPVVVFFHGGGLRNGDKDASAHVGQAFAARGIAAAVVNYRLSPTVEHPAHAEDAARAIAWVHRNIGEHGGNPEKLFLSGHSAGAYLAALLALDPRYLRAVSMAPSDLAGTAPISGFFYVDLIAPDRPKDVWGTDEAVWRDASPSRYVRGDAPPMLLVYADGDDPWRREQNENLNKALAAKGHDDVETIEIADRDHTGIWSSLSVEDAALESIVRFINAR